jgi:Glycosyltransferases involved in cell wall biogenesis
MATKIISLPSEKLEFAKWRNAGLKEAKGSWVFYLDADERATPELQKEIKAVMGIRNMQLLLFRGEISILGKKCILVAPGLIMLNGSFSKRN